MYRTLIIGHNIFIKNVIITFKANAFFVLINYKNIFKNFHIKNVFSGFTNMFNKRLVVQ